MTERLGRLRHLGARAVLLGTGNGDALENINTTKLNDGALCYVTEQLAYYMLDRELALSTISPVQVHPLAGPGTWVRIAAEAGVSGPWATSTATSENQTVTINSQNVWVNQPSNTNLYAIATGIGALWSSSTTSGILTYLGPDRDFLITAHIALAATQAAAETLEMVPDLGTLVGTGSSSIFSERVTTDGTAGPVVEISASRILRLANGDAVRAVIRNLTDTNDLTMIHLQLLAQPLAA